MRTQVAIIGGGPSGLLLGQLLHRQGIETVILERQTKAYVLGRIRAGTLEAGFVSLMHAAGVGNRMEQESFVHDGAVISFEDKQFRIDFETLTGAHVVVYGQTEVTRDLYDAREAAEAQTFFETKDVTILNAETDRPEASTLS